MKNLLFLLMLLPGPALAQDPPLFGGLETPVPSASALPPGSCAELDGASARLDCLKTRVQRQEKHLLPDVLAFLATGPQTSDLPLAWMPAFSQPALLRQLAGALKGQTNPVIRQHLLLLFQELLSTQPKLIDAATRQQVLDQAKGWLGHAHGPTRLQAMDLWLSQQKGLAAPLLKQMLASASPQERALALVHAQRWVGDPALKKLLPPLPAQTLLGWTQADDAPLDWLGPWTRHPIFRGVEAATTFHAFLGQWLETSPPDTVKLAESSLFLLLKHPHPDLRRFALRRLALSGNAAYAPRIEALIGDPDPGVRLRATESLTQLHKLVPLQSLASLKDPKRLPPDTPERIRALMRHPETRNQLLDPAYRHLARQPAWLEELWTLLQTSSDPALQLKGLQALEAAPMSWPVDKLQPLLETSQDVRVRGAALVQVLRRPYSPELGQLLRPLLRDPQAELPLEILNYLFRIRAHADTRNLLAILANRPDQRVDRRLLSFDKAQSTSTLEDLVAGRLDDWIEAADRKGETLPDWLDWARDPALPRPWRRAIVKLIGDEGEAPVLLPRLRQLMQDPELSTDAEFALDAVEARLENKRW